MEGYQPSRRHSRGAAIFPPVQNKLGNMNPAKQNHIVEQPTPCQQRGQGEGVDSYEGAVGQEGLLALKCAHSEPQAQIHCADSGSTGVFGGDGSLLYEVKSLKNPIPVKMGTTTSSFNESLAHLIPQKVLVVMYVCLLVDNFQKNLILYSTDLLWHHDVLYFRPAKGEGTAYMYKHRVQSGHPPPSASSLKDTANAFFLEIRSNGLMTFPVATEDELRRATKWVDFISGKTLSSSDDETILSHCTVVARNRGLETHYCNVVQIERPIEPKRLRVFMIGAGKCTESQLIRIGLPIVVVGVVEVSKPLMRACQLFPRAQLLEDLIV
mmetsp:Transcript_6533/g.20596  ORF Transcript_6533/g.20596 Transcript_6533/m.20596 type:complete len:324 (+) Transcript_6533:1101-2072(+)